MNKEQLHTLEFIKKHFNVEIVRSLDNGDFKTNQELSYGHIFKNGNFKYRLNRYGFSYDGSLFQMCTWGK